MPKKIIGLQKKLIYKAFQAADKKIPRVCGEYGLKSGTFGTNL
nr:MAG TPA: hypothetical protein [Caudoviricetes sp.]